MSFGRQAIGIDLGASYSCVSVFRNGKVEIIPNEHGNRTTPSYVSFTDRDRLVGDAAKNQVNLNPINTVFGVQRLIGRKFDDPTVQAAIKHWPFKVINCDGKPKVQVEYRKETIEFAPAEILAMILAKMKAIAETHLDRSVYEAVIAVPASFNRSQRHAIKDAGLIAGLTFLRIVTGSTLAAMTYDFPKHVSTEQNILVFDLGGGTLNVSVLTIEDGMFEVKSTAGDLHLGGEDFDNRMIAYCVEEFRRRNNKDLSGNKCALQRLRTACESAKHILSSYTQTSIEIESLYDGISFHTDISRTHFEELCDDLFHSILEPVENALRDAKMDKSQIHEIVLVGGSTRIRKVQNLLKDFFDGKELNKSINPDEAIASGAAIRAAVVTGAESGEIMDVLLLDAVPFSLGIDTAGGAMTTVIKRNTTIPTQETITLTTSSDDQSDFCLRVFEGDHAMIEDNNLLGVLELSGISPAPRGVPQIEVSFEITVNSTLNVSARDATSGNETKLTIIDYEDGLSREDTERMTFDTEKFQKDDKIQRERDTDKVSVELHCPNTKETINDEELPYKVNAHQRKTIIEKTKEVLEWMETNQDVGKDEYECKLKELTNVCNSVLGRFSNETSPMT